MMKKILIPFLLMLAFSAKAQLNNSWIDYNKTYYKFKVSKDTLCRIPQSALQSIGLGAVNADHFQLWRNGEQVRLYTSVSGTTLGASDFIEFWGQLNDGKPDKRLYRDQTFQLTDKYSLETDTSTYFLTVNSTSPNLRYINSVNTSPSNTTADPYFMRKIDTYYKDQINRGFAYPIGEYVYSSAYDVGEGWSSNNIAPFYDLALFLGGLNVYQAGPANSVSIRLSASGNAPNERSVRVRLFNDSVAGIIMPHFTDRKLEVNNLPLSLLVSPDFVPVSIGSTFFEINPQDRFVVHSFGITYPARFKFNGQKNFAFELAAAPAGNNLSIEDFNYGTIAPILYDINAGRRYLGDITSTPGRVRFVLPPSTDANRKFILVNQEPGSLYSIPSLTTRNFVNYNNTALQADYIIISHPALYNDGSGNNYVEQFRQYRSSSDGGGYNAKIYNIEELVDQFGYGIKKHPSSVRDFLIWANQNFAVKPKYVFIIGRGMNYIDQRTSESNPIADKIDLVPAFGWPASDILLASMPGTVMPIIPIGRLAAVNGQEVNAYLQKVLQYEEAQRTNSASIADKAWMKNVLHVVGGKDSEENAMFRGYMGHYQRIVEDSLFGGRVETFSKTSTGATQEANSLRIQQLFNEGLGVIGYFGHSSANTFEFNLSEPNIYNNAGKYPFFNVSGCSAGNFYIFDPARLTGSLTLSEKYILASQRGSIGFLADTHFGVPPYLDVYNTNLYTEFSKNMYGNTIGNQIQKVITDVGGLNPNLEYFIRVHAEEISLHGDPAIKVNYFPLPDYVIEDQLVKISPSIISVADNNFNVSVKMQNKGRVVNDSIWVSVKRKLPNDSIKVLLDSLIPSIKNIDSFNLVVPINPATDKGLNQLLVSLDYTNRVAESYETNNTLTKDFYVFEDELRPAYPTNYAIVHNQNITYVASSANALSAQRQYVMEVDTTEQFNSAFKKSYNSNGAGGVVQFTPSNITFTDSTVYYWRVAMVPLNNDAYIWNSFSFVYIPNSSEGVNQSHYYQHQKSSYTDMSIGTDRKFKFDFENTALNISTGNYPPNDYESVHITLGIYTIANWGNIFNTLQFVVLDNVTGSAMKNIPVSPTQGAYGSNYPDGGRENQFEFPFNTLAQRNTVRDFLRNNVPNSAHVVMYNLLFNNVVNAWAEDWKADEAINGTGNTLYHTLKGYGFTMIDSFHRNIPFIFKFNKDNSSPSYQQVGENAGDVITAGVPLTLTRSGGSVTSPVFGPAKSWKEFHWRGYSLEANSKDSVRFNVIGINNTGTETTLYSIDSTTKDLDISAIDALQYPFIKLRMENYDSAKGTPYQLRYWRLNYLPVPEGAIAPNVSYAFRDSVEQGETINFSVAFKNISSVAFDSLLKVRVTIKDRNNNDHVENLVPRKALAAGDTLMIQYAINTANYPGNNTLAIDVNPDNAQREQYHYNNVLYKNFFVKEDKFNPLLDVTFDAVHILNKDIVAAKPNILIKLKDESRFLALKDTALLKVQVRLPDDNQTLKTYHFDNDTMRFIPANLSAGENTASIEFKPYFPDDGEYELIVSGKDVNGNVAGELKYNVMFSVINKPMISNMLNYPNPFTTSTAFVFTVTGMEVPQNIRIQILTITGKVVREITKDELGPIHIGRNITEYKWDGTDMYGQKLANGVYLYRVLTNLNGKSLDKYKANGDNTDKFFNKGYGKMYLMR
jgi:hypothetical protein